MSQGIVLFFKCNRLLFCLFLSPSLKDKWIYCRLYQVLRLWLERKILPESILRRFMDDIGVSNDDKMPGFSQRRPSRAERAIDDPIREMEGMLVDEYGRFENIFNHLSQIINNKYSI